MSRIHAAVYRLAVVEYEFTILSVLITKALWSYKENENIYIYLEWGKTVDSKLQTGEKINMLAWTVKEKITVILVLTGKKIRLYTKVEIIWWKTK